MKEAEEAGTGKLQREGGSWPGSCCPEEGEHSNGLTSKPCRRPRFIMSLQRFGTRHINSTAFCGGKNNNSSGAGIAPGQEAQGNSMLEDRDLPVDP